MPVQPLVRQLSGRLAIIGVVALAAAACGDSSSKSPPPSVGAWDALAPVPGGPLQETAVVALQGRIYVLGGFRRSGNIVDSALVYDPGTDTWSAAAPMPAPVHHVNAAAVGERIYVVGALAGNDFEALSVTWEYNPAADQWLERQAMPFAARRGASAVGVVDGIIYVAGGYRGGSVADVSSYDPVTDQHTALEPMPEALNHLVGASVDGRFFAIGGRDVGIGGIKSRVDRYDVATNSWQARSPMPTARGGMAGGVVDGRIVVVGGEGNPASGSAGVFPDVELYDPVSDSWQGLPPMRFPRHGMGAVGLDGSLYVPGGADRQGFAAVADHDALRLRELL